MALFDLDIRLARVRSSAFSNAEEERTILARGGRHTIATVAVALVLTAVSLLSWGTPSIGTSSTTSWTSPTTAPPATATEAPAESNGTSTLGCDGVFWASWVWGNYSPPWCVGQDEATMSFVSDAPGSGEDANYSLQLPADSSTYPQADFYATIWLGGVVYDTSSLDDQAYLEFQFYPAPPSDTGPGSGAQDCLPNGAFSYTYDPGSNDWFACADVWQVNPTSDVESAAFAGPLDVQDTTSIFEFHSNDQIYVNDSGVAKSALQPWQLSVTDSSTHTTGSVSLKNGSTILSPFYTTAAAGNDLIWGADIPGAFSIAYEIGHSLNPAIHQGGVYDACFPGDGQCDSYWPGRWGQSGQLQLSLPVMGSAGNQTYPYDIALGSSVEGENYVNGTNTIPDDSTECTAPSWSSSTNCLYPWYSYRAQNYSFTFDDNNETNNTHNYGYWYEFPGAEQTVRFHAAPWGVLDSVVTPSFVKVEFNRLGASTVVPVLENSTVYRQFMEGPYWLNVSYPGCQSVSTYVYLSAGATYNTPIHLDCAGLYAVTFNETGLPTGTAWSVTINGTSLVSTGSSITFYLPNGTLSYSVLSPVPGSAGVRYVASPDNGTVDVLAAPQSKSIAYTPQFELTAVASPASAAVIEPNLVWDPPGTVVSVTVLPGPSWVFVSWTGIGDGSYTGTANPASVVLNGPIQEAAFLYFLYTVSFTETGLPSHTSWSVDLNGVSRAGSAPTINFQLPNGSYSYTIKGPSGYTISSPSGSGSITGASVNLSVQFTAIVFLGLTAIDLEILTIISAAVAFAIGINVAFWLTRRKRPPTTRSSSPGPPPPWLRGPPP